MKADKATVRARVEDIARVILDGIMPFQISPYVSEMEAQGASPWAVPDGGSPLSSRQVRRYARWAERLIALTARTGREKSLRNHKARRQSLYARAVNKGDERTALAILADLAKLEGLYPSEDDELKREAEAMRKQMAEWKEAHGGGGNGGAAAGTDGPGERGEEVPEPDP
jgi:hypothetical protein